MRSRPLLALFWMATSAIAAGLELRITPPAGPILAGGFPQFAAEIENTGSGAVSLILPGDGSESKWRTPVVGWSILPADRPELAHPAEPPLLRGGRCGNVNSLQLSEVFTLKPGEKRALGDWIGQPRFDRPGRYRVVFYYQNLPELRFRGLAAKAPSARIVREFRASTPCLLRSREMVVEVRPPG